MLISQLAVLVFAVLVYGDEDPSSVFLLSPRPSLAPLNSITIFTCRAASRLVQELLWEVDGGQTSSSAYAAVLRERGIHWSSTEDPERGWTTLQLRAHATATNNGTEIQCVAFPTSSSKVRKTALTTLTVYDRPDTPTGVSLSARVPLQLNLSWVAPYSHPNVSLSYTITITTRDAQSGVVIGPSRSETVQNTSVFIFKLNIPSCDKYEFTVAAENGAGTSEDSTAVAGTLPIPPNTTVLSSSLSHDLAVIDNDVISCNISFQAATTCPNTEYPITRYTLHLTDTLTNTTNTSHLLPPHTLTPHPLRVALNSSDGLVQNTHYIYHIEVESGAGRVDSQTRDMFTTDVSHVTTSLHYPNLTITCHFLPGSLAQGCYVTLHNTSNTRTSGVRVNASLSEMLPRANSSLEAVTVFVLTQQPRCYWLEVYDWEAGGGVGRIPVPLETTDLESGRSCDIIEDGSNRMRPSPHTFLVPIIASVVGCVVLLAAMLFLVGLGIYCHRKTHTALPDKQDNQYSTEGQDDSKGSSCADTCTSDSFTCSETPPFPATSPPAPVYDQPENLATKTDGDGGVQYSSLTRTSSTTTHTVLTAHDPNYSKLNEFAEYACIERGPSLQTTNPLEHKHLPPTPDCSHTYCEIDTISSGQGDSKPYDFINSLPSAGTTV